MNDLISLVKLISTQKIEQIDLFNSKIELPFKTRKLYEGIINGKITSEPEGMIEIYGELGQKGNFNKLQSRLKKRLLNTLFFLDFNGTAQSGMYKAKYKIARDTHLVKILSDRHEKQNAYSLAKKTLALANKYEQTDYSLILARYLFTFYSLFSPNKRKKEKINDEIVRLEKIQNAEILAERYYNDVSFIYLTKKTKFEKKELQKMNGYMSELSVIQKEITSFSFNLNTYNIITSYYILNGEYDKSIKYSSEALSFFDSKPYNDNASKWSFRNSLILSAIGKKEFSIAEEHTKANFEILPVGSYNWYMQCNYHHILLSAQGKFQQLYLLILDVINSKNYNKFILQNEYWKVIEAYINFLIRMDKIDPSLNTSRKKLRPFSLSRFLNDVPKFSKDKRGLNISILIIQFLFLLLDRKYSKLIDRLDAIKQYSYRYLKNDESYRSNLFIKMLLKVADADFHPIAAKRYTKDMYSKLLESNPSINFQSTEIEVIPYEKLWEIVMELLEKNRKGNTT